MELVAIPILPALPTRESQALSCEDEQGRPCAIELDDMPFFEALFQDDWATQTIRDRFPSITGYTWNTFCTWAKTRRTANEILFIAWMWFQHNKRRSKPFGQVQCRELMDCTFAGLCQGVWNFTHWLNEQCRARDPTVELLAPLTVRNARYALAEMLQLAFWTLSCFNYDVGCGNVTRKRHDSRDMIFTSSYDQGSSCRIGLRGSTGKWLCHDDQGDLKCDRDSCQEWETLLSVPKSDGQVTLKTWRDELSRLIGTVTALHMVPMLGTSRSAASAKSNT